MTNEQRIRGADRGVDSAIIVTGYDVGAVSEHAQGLIGDLSSRGARGVSFNAYRSAYSLASAELEA